MVQSVKKGLSAHYITTFVVPGNFMKIFTRAYTLHTYRQSPVYQLAPSLSISLHSE